MRNRSTLDVTLFYRFKSSSSPLLISIMAMGMVLQKDKQTLYTSLLIKLLTLEFRILSTLKQFKRTKSGVQPKRIVH